MKNKIIRILMNRDGMTWSSARETVQEVQDVINDLLLDDVNYNEVAAVVEDMLGLEPDYIEAFIY